MKKNENIGSVNSKSLELFIKTESMFGVFTVTIVDGRREYQVLKYSLMSYNMGDKSFLE